MTVQELIEQLNEVSNKNLTVYGFGYGEDDSEIEEIDHVDELDDRVDLNTVRDY